MRHLRVLTPELVPLEYPLAGLPERGIAWMIDEFLLYLVMGVIGGGLAIVGLLTLGAGLPFAFMLYFVGKFVLAIVYRYVAETRYRGRTLGKRMLGLRTVQRNGAELQPWQSFVRNASRALDAFPLFDLTAVLAIFLDGEHRRIGDRLAGTVVIREERRVAPRGLRMLASAQNSLLEDRAAAGRIRTRLAAREAAMLTEFVAAAPRIRTQRRLELAERLATRYRERLGLESHAGLPDETLLKGVVGVIARERWGVPAGGR